MILSSSASSHSNSHHKQAALASSARESRCWRRGSRWCAVIDGVLIIHAEQLRYDSRLIGRSGCAAGSFRSCDLGQPHRHYSRRRQREVSLNACSRACATCLPPPAPMLLHGHADVRRSYGSWLWSPHAVLESPYHRCACRRPLQPRRAPACAGGAHCPSSAHGDLVYVGTQHMQSHG